MLSQRPYKSGFNLSQNENIDHVLKLLKKNLGKNQPTNIIEIGTYRGGFSYLLSDVFTKSKITTLDINPDCDIEKLSKETGINTYKMDTFSEEAVNLISSLIKEDGVCIVFCDGGNKPEEFKKFAQYLKYNDIILAHDYSPNNEYWENYMKDKIWNWHEIDDGQINDTCINNNLNDFMHAEFLSAAWVCKIKE